VWEVGYGKDDSDWGAGFREDKAKRELFGGQDNVYQGMVGKSR
jgi:hypothetical protein